MANVHISPVNGGGGGSGGSPPSLFPARGVPEIVLPAESVSAEARVLIPLCQLSASEPSTPAGVRSIVIGVLSNPEHQPAHAETAGVRSRVVVAFPYPQPR